ncbi:unnamed protein product [Rhizophagus irregularis]|nr:unnamed protein product [Rhizophagus irregularis]
MYNALTTSVNVFVFRLGNVTNVPFTPFCLLGYERDAYLDLDFGLSYEGNTFLNPNFSLDYERDVSLNFVFCFDFEL